MENDLKSDALNIGPKGQHELRKTIIRMLKDGKKGKEIAKFFHAPLTQYAA